MEKMSKTRILVEVGVPTPGQYAENAPTIRKSVEDKVREAIELVETGYCSDIEWIMLNKLYKQICECKQPNNRMLNIKQMIEPLLAKYGYHRVEALS